MPMMPVEIVITITLPHLLSLVRPLSIQGKYEIYLLHKLFTPPDLFNVYNFTAVFADLFCSPFFF